VLRAALGGQEVSDAPLSLPDALGQPREFLARAVPLRDEKTGRPRGAVAALLDVTDWRRAEQALREESRRSRAILDASADGIHILDPEGRVVDVNPAFCALLGYRRDELLAMRVSDWDVQWSEAELRARLGTPRPARTVATRYRRRDGAVLDVEVSAVDVELGAQRVVLCAARDLGERRRAEERTRFLWRAVEQSPASIVITDVSGTIVYVNPKFTEVTGWRPEEAIGQTPRLLKSGHHPPWFYQDLWSTILAGRQWRGELCNRRKSGELFWESASISGVGEGGAVTHFVAVKLDISDQRRLEAEYRQAQKMEAVGRLAGGVAHDFNNVLTIIQGQVELLLMQLGEQDPRRRKLEQIKRAGERAAGLSRQLLAFSRRQALEPRPVDLAALVGDMEKMLRRLIGEDVTLVVRGEPGTARVLADPGQMEQVLLNLVINARDAMPRGGTLTIETDAVDVAPGGVFWRPGLAAGPAVRLRVSDTGQGIPAEIRDRIFEPFFTTKGEGKGTGLGLSIVYGVVRQSGGAVWADSEDGRGAAFTIVLPRLAREAAEAAAAPEAPAGGRGETILVVEDQEEVRAVITEVLKQAGYRVLAAREGAGALALAATYAGPIHLLVTDVVMPGLNGREVAEALQASRPDIGVLFVSGYTADVLTAHGLEAGHAALLEKPATPAVLRRKVRELLDACPGRARG
jgi:PAS domain S-box-containing protein